MFNDISLLKILLNTFENVDVHRIVLIFIELNLLHYYYDKGYDSQSFMTGISLHSDKL